MKIHVARTFRKSTYERRWAVLDKQTLSLYEKFDLPNQTPVNLKKTYQLDKMKVFQVGSDTLIRITNDKGKEIALIDCVDSAMYTTWFNALTRASLLQEEIAARHKQRRQYMESLNLKEETISTVAITSAYSRLLRGSGKGTPAAVLKDAHDYLIELQRDADLRTAGKVIQFEAEVVKALGGVGLGIVVMEDKIRKRIVIQNVVEGIELKHISEEAGGNLLPGDILTAIDGEDCTDWFLSRVRARFGHYRVPLGAAVTLKFERLLRPALGSKGSVSTRGQQSSSADLRRERGVQSLIASLAAMNLPETEENIILTLKDIRENNPSLPKSESKMSAITDFTRTTNKSNESNSKETASDGRHVDMLEKESISSSTDEMGIRVKRESSASTINITTGFGRGPKRVWKLNPGLPNSAYSPRDAKQDVSAFNSNFDSTLNISDVDSKEMAESTSETSQQIDSGSVGGLIKPTTPTVTSVRSPPNSNALDTIVECPSYSTTPSASPQITPAGTPRVIKSRSSTPRSPHSPNSPVSPKSDPESEVSRSGPGSPKIRANKFNFKLGSGAGPASAYQSNRDSKEKRDNAVTSTSRSSGSKDVTPLSTQRSSGDQGTLQTPLSSSRPSTGRLSGANGIETGRQSRESRHSAEAMPVTPVSQRSDGVGKESPLMRQSGGGLPGGRQSNGSNHEGDTEDVSDIVKAMRAKKPKMNWSLSKSMGPASAYSSNTSPPPLKSDSVDEEPVSEPVKVQNDISLDSDLDDFDSDLKELAAQERVLHGASFQRLPEMPYSMPARLSDVRLSGDIMKSESRDSKGGRFKQRLSEKIDARKNGLNSDSGSETTSLSSEKSGQKKALKETKDLREGRDSESSPRRSSESAGRLSQKIYKPLPGLSPNQSPTFDSQQAMVQGGDASWLEGIDDGELSNEADESEKAPHEVVGSSDKESDVRFMKLPGMPSKPPPTPWNDGNGNDISQRSSHGGSMALERKSDASGTSKGSSTGSGSTPKVPVPSLNLQQATATNSRSASKSGEEEKNATVMKEHVKNQKSDPVPNSLSQTRTISVMSGRGPKRVWNLSSGKGPAGAYGAQAPAQSPVTENADNNNTASPSSSLRSSLAQAFPETVQSQPQRNSISQRSNSSAIESSSDGSRAGSPSFMITQEDNGSALTKPSTSKPKRKSLTLNLMNLQASPGGTSGNPERSSLFDDSLPTARTNVVKSVFKVDVSEDVMVMSPEMHRNSSEVDINRRKSSEESGPDVRDIPVHTVSDEGAEPFAIQPTNEPTPEPTAISTGLPPASAPSTAPAIADPPVKAIVDLTMLTNATPARDATPEGTRRGSSSWKSRASLSTNIVSDSIPVTIDDSEETSYDIVVSDDRSSASSMVSDVVKYDLVPSSSRHSVDMQNTRSSHDHKRGVRTSEVMRALHEDSPTDRRRTQERNGSDEKDIEDVQIAGKRDGSLRSRNSVAKKAVPIMKDAETSTPSQTAAPALEISTSSNRVAASAPAPVSVRSRSTSTTELQNYAAQNRDASVRSRDPHVKPKVTTPKSMPASKPKQNTWPLKNVAPPDEWERLRHELPYTEKSLQSEERPCDWAKFEYTSTYPLTTNSSSSPTTYWRYRSVRPEDGAGRTPPRDRDDEDRQYYSPLYEHTPRYLNRTEPKDRFNNQRNRRPRSLSPTRSPSRGMARRHRVREGRVVDKHNGYEGVRSVSRSPRVGKAYFDADIGMGVREAVDVSLMNKKLIQEIKVQRDELVAADRMEQKVRCELGALADERDRCVIKLKELRASLNAQSGHSKRRERDLANAMERSTELAMELDAKHSEANAWKERAERLAVLLKQQVDALRVPTAHARSSSSSSAARAPGSDSLIAHIETLTNQLADSQQSLAESHRENKDLKDCIATLRMIVAPEVSRLSVDEDLLEVSRGFGGSTQDSLALTDKIYRDREVRAEKILSALESLSQQQYRQYEERQERFATQK